jgi:hypothetical protein
MTVEEAMLRHHAKLLKKPQRSRKNAKPEKEVEKQIMPWLEVNGFSCHVIESKAVYSAGAGRYLRGQADQGFSDIVGCDENGIAAFIELKALGKCSTLKRHQFDFLKSKIDRGAFAVCVDSAEMLNKYYNIWSASNKRTTYLYSLLPKKHFQKDAEESVLF